MAADPVILEQKFLPQFKKVRRLLNFLFLDLLDYGRVLGVAQDFSALAAVVGYEPRAVGKFYKSALAVVGAEGANYVCLLLVRKIIQCVKTYKGRGLGGLFHFFLCQKRRSYRSHDAGVGRAVDFLSGVLFHRAQDRVVLEGSALDYDFFTQRVDVGNADYFCEHVLDYRAAKARHYVLGQLSVPLFGHDGTGHKDRAAASQNRGAL